MEVRVRPENGNYLLYFLNSRRVLYTNELGAEIINNLFNEGGDINDIVLSISTRYSINASSIKKDIREFLNQVEKELNPTIFNIIDQTQLEAPLGAELEITTDCNLRCSHCLQQKYEKSYISFDDACEIINILCENNVMEISLIGGEPFKHDRLIDILDYCNNKNMASSVVTNGTLISEKITDRLAIISNCVVMVSLDGIGAVNDLIRGKGVFKKIDKSIRELVKKDVSTEILYTLNAINSDNYREVLEYAASLDIPCNFNLFKPFKPEHISLIIDPKKFFKIVIELFSLRQKGKYKIGLANAAIVAYLMGLPPRNECRASLAGIVVNHKKKILTCPSLVMAGYYKDEDFPKFNRKFLSIWRNHKIFSSFRKNDLRQCPARSFIFNKNIKSEDPYGITAFQRFIQTNY